MLPNARSGTLVDAAPVRFSSERPPRLKSPRIVYLPGKIRVVHEDEDIIVVDKPTGMLSVGTPDHDRENVFDILKAYVRDSQKRRGSRVWVIHRLDKEASGLIVFAKSQRAFDWLKEDFRSKRVRRIYYAVVQDAAGKHVPGTRSAVQSFLAEDEDGAVRSVPTGTRAKARTVQKKPGEDEAPKLAVTHYKVVASGNGRALLELKLDTGRKNQIRVHMAEFGTPIIGDRRYGASEDPLDRVCLHAAELGLTHAGTGQRLEFDSPVPPTFGKLLGGAAKVAGDGEAIETPSTDLSPGASQQPTTDRPTKRKETSAPNNPAPAPTTPTPTTSWDNVADWYDDLLTERKSDHHERVIIPGVLRLLNPGPKRRILDVACGQGQLAQTLAQQGASVVGVDASPKLIASARKSAGSRCTFEVGDARTLDTANLGTFTAACCIMALMNIEPLAPVFRGIQTMLEPGGTFVGVILHPAFRAPGQTSWGWETQPNADAQSSRNSPDSRNRGPSRNADRQRNEQPDRAPATVKQFRRVDGYLSPGQREIIMNPGAAASGKSAVTTVTYHRPIQTYVRLCAEAGLLIDAIEEWPSLRASEPGPRAAEENRSRREIPMFLAFRARKI